MTITYVGSLSIGEAVPASADVAVSGAAGIALALPDLQARLAALAAFAPAPISFAAQLTTALNTVLSIQSAITLGLVPPSIDAQIAIVTAQVAALEAAALAVDVEAAAIGGFQNLIATGGLFAYAIAANANAVGGNITTQLAGGLPGGLPADATNSILLITSTPATWTAMQTMFKVTP